MATIVYESLTGNIISAFDTSQVVPPLPVGYSTFVAVGDLTALAAMHIDIGGPALEILDYLRYTAPVSHLVDTIEVYGIQKVDGDTDVDTALPADNEGVLFRVGNADAVPGTQNGFLEEYTDQLLLGAAAVKLASGSVAGTEVLFAKAGVMQIASKTLTYT